MIEPREWWIYKGTSDFCRELVLDEACENMIRDRPDGFYDIVQTKDTVSGGIHVIEHAAYLALVKERDRLREEISDLSYYRDHKNCLEETVRECGRLRSALERIVSGLDEKSPRVIAHKALEGTK